MSDAEIAVLGLASAVLIFLAAHTHTRQSRRWRQEPDMARHVKTKKGSGWQTTYMFSKAETM